MRGWEDPFAYPRREDFDTSGMEAGGSIFKQEKCPVLWHRAGSRRRATPAAFLSRFQDKVSRFGIIDRIIPGCRFWSLGAW